jgi:hypothetical protein
MYNLVGTTEVAKECKITPQGVRKAIEEGRLKADWIGNRWVITRREMIRFKKQRERRLRARRKRR